MPDFGVIIGCCNRDFAFAKGTVASIRHFSPNTPICLLIDGDINTRPLERAYPGVTSLHRAAIKNDFLRQNSFGYGLSKMAALWESPFERFLFLDADTVMWGDLIPLLRLEESWDFHVDQNRTNHTDALVNQFFFDTDRFEQQFPDYPWRPHANDYFCTGVWAARRGIFPLDEYQEILRIQAQTNRMFKMGEMGFLNFMIFRAKDQGRAIVRQSSLQTIVSDFSPNALINTYGIDRDPASREAFPPTVLHYTHPKPFVSTPTAGPMTTFRRAAARALGQPNGLLLSARLGAEDFHFDLPHLVKRNQARFQRLIARVRK